MCRRLGTMTKIPTRFLSPFFFLGKRLSLHEGSAPPEAAMRCRARQPRPSGQAGPQLTALAPTRPSTTLMPYPQLLRAGKGAREKLIARGHRPSLSRAPLQTSQVKASLLESCFSFSSHLVTPFCPSKPGSSSASSPPQSDRRVSMETTKVSF